MLSRREYRRLRHEHLSPYLDRAKEDMSVLGAREEGLRAVDVHFRDHWVVSSEVAPDEVWCGEVLWPAHDGARSGIPEAILFPDSPWGRLPGQRLFALATQTGVDHMVSHLYRWFAGVDYSENEACADQVRLMVARRRPFSAAVVALGLWRHKKIPLRSFWRAAADVRAQRLASIFRPAA